MRISEVIFREEYLFCDANENAEFCRINYDLKDIKNGDLIFLFKDETEILFDPNSCVPVSVVCSPNAVLPCNIPSIRVENPRLALSKACFRFEKIKSENVKIIGVTGTNGKTTTATLIFEVLSKLGQKVGFIGTGKITIGNTLLSDDNYSMTTPDPPILYSAIRQMIDSDCEYIVMEVSSHSLALDKVTPIEFDYGVFTNLSSEHLDFHKNIEAYFSAKARLFDRSKCKVINIDDSYGMKLFQRLPGRKISVGVLQDGFVKAQNVKSLGFDGVSYTYKQKDFSFKMRYHPAGIYNVYNTMLAATVCIDIGCKPCEVKKVIGEISSIQGRYEIIKDKITVIIDYAHTSEAFENILRDISRIKSARRLTVVFGCGGNRDKTKRPTMAKIAEKYCERIILTSDNSRKEGTKEIISDIIQGFDKGNYEIKENRKDAIFSAILEADDAEIVAIIGKGPEKYNIDKEGYHPFDEKEIIFSALKIRNERHKICVSN